MGVPRLLQLLKPAGIDTHLSDHGSCTVGVDGYAWLHRSVTCCAEQLALEMPTDKHVRYFETRVRSLLHHNITPFIIFDGDHLPAKAGVENERSANRAKSLELGKKLLKQGKRRDAYKQFVSGVNVSPAMAAQVMTMLDRIGVQYVVAPYEADAQLAYMEKVGQIDAVISEDSDLLVFGVKRLWTKLDSSGNFVEMRRDQFHNSYSVDLSLLSDAELRRLAIVNGCDYSPGLPGIGLVKGYSLVRGYDTIEELLEAVQSQGGTVPDNFEETARLAEVSFLHQRVYCIELRKNVMLTDLPEDIDEESKTSILNYIGPELDTFTATSLAIGAIHPMTKDTLRYVSAAKRSWTVPLASKPSVAESRVQKLMAETPKALTSSVFFAPKTETVVDCPDNTIQTKEEKPTHRVLRSKAVNKSQTISSMWSFNPYKRPTEQVTAANKENAAQESPVKQQRRLGAPRLTRQTVVRSLQEFAYVKPS